MYSTVRAIGSLAPRGETQWVRNARVSGEVWLKRGRTRQRFKLRALDDRDKPEILREYLSRYRLTVQRYFAVPAGAGLEMFSDIVRQYPVFELIPQYVRRLYPAPSSR